LKPERLRNIIDSMPRQSQIFAGAFGELWEHTNAFIRGESSATIFVLGGQDILDTVCEELQLTQDEVLWVIAFLSAGPAVSGTTLPAAEDCPPADRGSGPVGGVTPFHQPPAVLDNSHTTLGWPDAIMEASNGD
jgi:hypothetical protein